MKLAKLAIVANTWSSAVPTLRMVGQEDYCEFKVLDNREFKASSGYKVRSHLKQQTNKKTNRTH